MSAIDRINKKLKNIELQEQVKAGKISSSDATAQRIEDLTNELRNNKGKIDYADTSSIIAPVKTTSSNNISSNKEEDKPWYKKIFTKGGLSDGYDFGDVTKTLLATDAEITKNLTKGAASVFEAPVDIGSNLVASGLNAVGFKNAAKSTREFANKDFSSMAGNLAANTTSPGKIYNAITGNYKNSSDVKKAATTNEFEKDSASGYYADKTTELVGYTLGMIAGTKGLDKLITGGSVGINTVKGTTAVGAGINGGNITATVAGKTLNLPILAITGGMSSGLQEANSKENVTEAERWSKALSSGFIEGATEGLFGMFGVGGSSFDDWASSKAASAFTSSAGKMLAKIGVSSSGEAAEEFFSYAGNYFADNKFIDKIGNADFSQKWDWSEVGEQMALAFASSMITSGGGTIVQNNSAISEAEKQLGRKLTDKEKAQVTQAVIEGTAENKLNNEINKNQINNTVTQEEQTNSLVEAPSNTLNNVNNEEIIKNAQEIENNVQNNQEDINKINDKLERQEIDNILNDLKINNQQSNTQAVENNEVKNKYSENLIEYLKTKEEYDNNKDMSKRDSLIKKLNHLEDRLTPAEQNEVFKIESNQLNTWKSGENTQNTTQSNTQAVDNTQSNNNNKIETKQADTSYRGKDFDKANGRGITADQFLNNEEDKIAENSKTNVEALEQLKKVRNNPEETITIYRATPGESINEGDWVFLDKEHADKWTKTAFGSPKPGFKVVEMNVKAKDVDWSGKNLEFVYSPNSEAQEIANSEKNNIPTTQELDNLENIRQNQSGSEYAAAFYDLENKYGKANLYKGINEYNSSKKANLSNENTSSNKIDIAPIKEATNELKMAKKEVSKQVKEIKEEINTIKSDIQEELAPIKEMIEDFKALTEKDLPMVYQQADEGLQSITDNDVPAMKEDTTPEVEEVTPTKSLNDIRDYEEVGSKKVNAYQYDNPEVKPYFQEAAIGMLTDLDMSTKGERIMLGDMSQGSNNDYEYTGTKRNTTDDIAQLLDGFEGKYQYSYAEIKKGLNAIIEDHGAENIAVAKRIEFYLDERLRNGYTTIDGYEIPPNQEYLNTLQAKEYTDYYDSLPQNDIAPYEEIDTIEDIAPVKETNQLDYIPSDPTKESSYDNEVPKTRKQMQRRLETVNRQMERVNELASRMDNALNEYNTRIEEAKNNTLGNSPLEEYLNETIVKGLYEQAAPFAERYDKYSTKLQELTEERNKLEEDIANTPEKKTKKSIQRELVEKTGIIEIGLDKANRMSKVMLNNTDPIRVQEMVFGQELGNKINDEFFQKVKNNTSEKIRWQNEQRNKIKELGIKARSKESAAVQKYAEKQWTNDKGETFTYGDNELAAEFSNPNTQEKIKTAAKEIRNLYDEYLEKVNPVLVEMGYNPIPKRTDYVRHFQELNDKFSQFGIPLNLNDMKANDLPTDINGLTADFSPGKNFFASALERTGNKTTYDAITGIDGYLEGIGNLIYHTEDVQRLRGFESYIRDTYGQQHGYENLEQLSDQEKVSRLKAIEDKSLSNYASWLHEYTNQLAGKKAMMDRAVEDFAGRRIYSILDTANRQVGSNMVGANIGSALTNVIPAVQSIAKTNKIAAVKGLADTVKNVFHNDGFVEKNGFLTSRFGSESLSKTPWQKMQDVGFMFMQGTDNFISNFVVRSKFNELKAKGYTDTEAHIEAGKYASKLMADRSQGAQPTLYNSKTLGILTKFQYEVNNQLYSMFYDTYQESKAKADGKVVKTTASMAMTLGQLAVFTHIFGAAFENMAGYNPTFDIIGILAKGLGFDDDEDDKDTLTENLGQAFNDLLKAMPYSSLFLDGGRIPVSEAFKGVNTTIKALTGGKNEYGQDVTWNDAKKDVLNTIPYWVMPTGYGQLKKTVGGLEMFDEDLPVAGSYTDSGNLRFTVEDTTENRVKSAIFGKWSNEEAQKYIDSGFKTISESKVEELKDLDMKSSEYRKLREKINEAGNTNEDKINYIASREDLSDNQKNILVNNILDRDYNVDVSDYSNFSSYEEFDYSYKNPEKYKWLTDNNISYTDYASSDESKEMYNYAYKNPDKYELGKAATNDFSDYYTYKKDIGDMSADKDSEGKSISGSRKSKVVSYVNGLNLSIPQKAMIIRTEYSSFDDYNNDIVEYVDSLDIDYSKKKTILESLDMKIDSDGTVRW